MTAGRGSRPFGFLAPLSGAALFPLLLGGCLEGGAAASDAVTVRDSAGISVVEVQGPVWAEDGGWRVEEEPLLVIGVVEGDPAEQLHRVADAASGPDGSVAIADGGSGEVRVFDASGAHVRTLGRSGDGPGEFRALRSLRVAGDTVWAYDVGPGRVTRFAPDGEVAEVVTLDVPDGRRPPRELWWLEGGDVVGPVAWPEPSEGFRTVPEGELRREPVALLRFGADGRLADTLAVHPGPEVFQQSSMEESGVFRSFEASPPFGRVSVRAPGPDGVWIGTGESRELRLHGWDGAPRRIVRHPGGEIPLERARVDSARAAALEGLDDPRYRRLTELLYRADRQPDALPPYSAALVDATGHLWVQEYRPPEGRPVRWDVFRPDGALLGPVELPGGFRPFRIAEDRIVGLRTDALGVERVVVLELER